MHKPRVLLARAGTEDLQWKPGAILERYFFLKNGFSDHRFLSLILFQIAGVRLGRGQRKRMESRHPITSNP
jgi:hypothetical protein